MRKSTHLWIAITGFTLNFSGVFLSLLVRNWGFTVVHLLGVAYFQYRVNTYANELDKDETNN